jgi:hypothetical protein
MASAAATRAGTNATAPAAVEPAPLGTAGGEVSHLLAAGLPTELCRPSLSPVPRIERRGAWTGRRLRARNRSRRSVRDRTTAGTIRDRTSTRMRCRRPAGSGAWAAKNVVVLEGPACAP